jgi:D-proline reductase (dithiol) PrdB
MPVDDYRYLPRSFVAGFQNSPLPEVGAVPFTPPRRPVREARVALVTTAGIWNRDADPPFDYEREQREPLWGDPTYRIIPADVRQEGIGAGHLHLNNDDLLLDFNVALPVARLRELVAAGEAGSAASEHYSFMGFQGRGPDGGGNTAEWEARYGPEAAARMLADGVEAVVVSPT